MFIEMSRHYTMHQNPGFTGEVQWEDFEESVN